MVNLKKTYLISSITSLSCFISFNAYSFDNFITVKFKQNPSKEYIQELNKMTNTKVEKNLGSNTYKLKVQGIVNKTKLDQYSEMFLIMKNVVKVSPLPKEKMDDKINPFYYMNINPNNPNSSKDKNSSPEQNNQSVQSNNEVNQDSNQVNNETQILTTPKMQSVPDEFIIKFNKGTPQEDIDLLNQGFGVGGNITYQKNNDTYKVKLPENVNEDYAKDFYQNNPMVESIKNNEIQAPITKTDEKKQDVETVQSGVALAIPLNGRDVKVTFKIGKSDQGYKWFENTFGAEMVTKKGFHTYVMRFPNNVNPKFAVRALKACSIVQSSEVVSE